MSKQVGQRGDTETNLDSSTPAQKEMAVDKTNWRLAIGDGATQGGVKIPNVWDGLNNVFYGDDAGGTADVLTVTLKKAPAAYVKFMEIVFKATASNTGSATMNVNGLGAKSIKKLVGGSVGNIVSGDIISGATYKIIYDGTDFILFGMEAGGLDDVSQGDLNTSQGTISDSNAGTASSSTAWKMSTFGGTVMPGGTYGFMMEPNNSRSGSSGGWFMCRDSSSYAAEVHALNFGETNSMTINGRQRYITSSPPFDLGDGEAGGFMFLRIKKSTGDILQQYVADVPPWAYNGPTDVRACRLCPLTGEKLRRVMKKRSLEEVMDGAKIEYEYQKITQAVKNADMGVIPAPFKPHAGTEIVLLDPMEQRVRDLIEYQNAGGDDVNDAIQSGKIYTDDEVLSRKGPKGVKITPLRFKYSG